MRETHAVYSRKTKVMLGICWALLLLLAVLMVFPAVYIILGSFKSNAELLVGGTKIFPSELYGGVAAGEFCAVYAKQCVFGGGSYGLVTDKFYHGRVRFLQEGVSGENIDLQFVSCFYVH